MRWYVCVREELSWQVLAKEWVSAAVCPAQAPALLLVLS